MFLSSFPPSQHNFAIQTEKDTGRGEKGSCFTFYLPTEGKKKNLLEMREEKGLAVQSPSNKSVSREERRRKKPRHVPSLFPPSTPI